MDTITGAFTILIPVYSRRRCQHTKFEIIPIWNIIKMKYGRDRLRRRNKNYKAPIFGGKINRRERSVQKIKLFDRPIINLDAKNEVPGKFFDM